MKEYIKCKSSNNDKLQYNLNCLEAKMVHIDPDNQRVLYHKNTHLLNNIFLF